MSTELCKKIKNLRDSGMSYRQIQSELGCSKGSISYYLGVGQKDKTSERRSKSRSSQHPYHRKIERFQGKVLNTPLTKKQICQFKKLITDKIRAFFMNRKTRKFETPTFTVEDVINKFGENLECYLTGDKIDIYKPRTYHFDHKTPPCKGGDNSIDNLGICTKEANMAKSDSTLEEFLVFCQKVIDKHKSER
jgi:predicted transcriptional regulator